MRTLLIPIVAAVLWSVAQTAAPGVAQAPATRTKVVCLGTGTPNPDPDRFGPATAVVVNDTPYVVDAGAGVVRRVTAAGKKGIPGMSVSKLTRLFITHLHSDRTIGYPDFIFTPAVTGRTEPLEVYGPPGLKAMTDHILEAWKEDMDIRIHGLEHGIARAYEVHVHEVTNGLVYQDANVRVRAFEVEHGAWPHALGYRFETADRTIPDLRGHDKERRDPREREGRRRSCARGLQRRRVDQTHARLAGVSLDVSHLGPGPRRDRQSRAAEATRALSRARFQRDAGGSARGSAAGLQGKVVLGEDLSVH